MTQRAKTTASSTSGSFAPHARSESEAKLMVADGRSIERIPTPQKEGEALAWLIRGDDHEYVLVEAVTEGEAESKGEEVFRQRYGGEPVVTVEAAFRGDAEDYIDLLEWVPGLGSEENDAYDLLESSGL